VLLPFRCLCPGFYLFTQSEHTLKVKAVLQCLIKGGGTAAKNTLIHIWRQTRQKPTEQLASIYTLSTSSQFSKPICITLDGLIPVLLAAVEVIAHYLVILTIPL
jgi:hypothetical protein